MEQISCFIIVVYFCKFSIFVKSQVHTISQTMTTIVTCPAHGFITCSNYMKNDFRLQYKTDQIWIFFFITIHVKHYFRICTGISIFVLTSKKTGRQTVYLRGGPGGQEQNGSKSWKAKKGNRESREHESWDKEPQSPLFTGSQESTNHEIRSPNPPSLQGVKRARIMR